jgi:transposase
MKELKTFMGVDISKTTLDIYLLGQQERHVQIANERKAIRKFITQFKDQENEICIGMENTGRYNVALLSELASHAFIVYVIAPLHLAKSLGLARGKNDKIDARRIAVFTRKNYAELKPWQSQRAAVTQLQLLLTERKRLVSLISELKTSGKELEVFEKSTALKTAFSVNKQMRKAAEKGLQTVERAIDELITGDAQLTQQANHITSVRGVGKILFCYLIVRTNEFRNINEPRKLACYAGVVPFERSSGTSIKGRHRLSYFADKELKKLLHLSAMRVIRLDGELKDYYQRKVAEGKNKMSVLNAVRNKLVHRICAVVNQKRNYTPVLEMS